MKKFVYSLIIMFCILPVFAMNIRAAGTDSDMNIYGIYLSKEGDATLIESEGEWLLIDTGLEEASDELLQKIRSYNVTELSILISHLHADHTGGVAALADSEIKINHLYLPDDSLTPYDEYTVSRQNKLIKNVQNNNSEAEITELKKGDELSFGDVSAKVLGPVSDITPDDFVDTETQTALEQYVNCRSLTIRFDCGDVSYITAGDIEDDEEEALVAKYKGTDELDADIMKLSHHALHTSNTKEFLAAVSPRYSFAQNSNKTISEGSNYRMYYGSCKNASQYGPVYLVGDETEDFKAKVSGGSIDIFKGEKELKGLVSLAGGDGTVVKTYKYYITGDEVKEGVYTIDGNKYYIFDGGFVKKASYDFELEKYVYIYEPVEGGDVRYFDLDGIMYTGFRKVNDNYFYFDPDTGLLLKGDEEFTPISIGKNKYAVNENGVIYNYNAISGAWKNYNSNYRYFDKNGVMQTGWITVYDEENKKDKKYYLDPKTGLRTIGLKELDGKTYYFIETNNAGYAWDEGWKSFDSNYRYFGSDGVMKTGWLTDGGKKYYMDPATGLRTLGLTKLNGKTYYFIETNSAGYMWNEGWKSFDSNYRYFGSDGVMKTGWLTDGGKKYYLNTKTGLRTLGLTKLNGKTYYFVETNSAGYMWDDGWKAFGSKKRYFDSNGVMYTGFRKIGSNYFYFDAGTGVLLTSDKNFTPVSVGNKKYAINENGAVYNYNKKSGAWKKYGSKYRYFGADGVMQTGWQTIDGKKYYLDPKTGYRATGFVQDGSKYYYVKDGKIKISTGCTKYKNVYLALSKTKYTYNGKAQKPKVKIYDANGKTISSKNYKVTYASGCKKVGKYKVTVKFKKKYSGSKSLYFTINPDDTSVSKVSAGNKSLKVTVKKKSKQVTGYQIQYSTSKKFTDSTTKTKTIKSYKTTSATLKSLKAKKTYYVRVRTYKTVSGKKYYSEWSKYKSKKTK